MLVENNTAVISGAGGANGGVVAPAFACQGVKIILAGRTLATIYAMAREISATERNLSEAVSS